MTDLVYNTNVHIEHTVDHRREVSRFQHGLECIMLRYTHTIHSRPWWNVHIT